MAMRIWAGFVPEFVVTLEAKQDGGMLILLLIVLAQSKTTFVMVHEFFTNYQICRYRSQQRKCGKESECGWSKLPS